MPIAAVAERTSFVLPEPKSSAHSDAELGSLSSSSLLSPCRAEGRQGVEFQAHGWRSISATARNEFDATRVEHRGFEPRTPCLPEKGLTLR